MFLQSCCTFPRIAVSLTGCIYQASQSCWHRIRFCVLDYNEYDYMDRGNLTLDQNPYSETLDTYNPWWLARDTTAKRLSEPPGPVNLDQHRCFKQWASVCLCFEESRGVSQSSKMGSSPCLLSAIGIHHTALHFQMSTDEEETRAGSYSRLLRSTQREQSLQCQWHNKPCV